MQFQNKSFDVRIIFVLVNILYISFYESAGHPLKRGCNFAYRAIKVRDGSMSGLIFEGEESCPQIFVMLLMNCGKNYCKMTLSFERRTVIE